MIGCIDCNWSSDWSPCGWALVPLALVVLGTVMVWVNRVYP